MLAAQEPNLLDTLWKLAVIAILAPLWIPVLKALYADFDGALREEGGLFGRAPNEDELERMRLDGEMYESPLINEPFEDGPARRAGSAPRSSAARAEADPGPRGAQRTRASGAAARPSQRGRGFLDR